MKITYLNKADRSDLQNRWRVLSVVIGRRYMVVSWLFWLPIPIFRFGNLDREYQARRAA